MTEESIFDQAIRATPAERPGLLERACSGDDGLRSRLERLLAVDLTPAGSPLDAGPAWEAAGIPVVLAEDRVGLCVGPYRLQQKLGEGGMGTVWAADQTAPVKRRVALKVVRTGVEPARVVARFEAERQALALMDHTSIAKVFDAGTTSDGRPYFAMELVRGVPITEYCDKVHASLAERLRLFTLVCQAVQHAHTKGVVHRDLKPSNILVAIQDGRPLPKVIDFGIAKALYQKLADKTMDTEVGQVIGTLEYMAPEQAELSPLDVDTRADVYALGVLLYELLVGSTPLSRDRLKSAALVEVLRLIKEEEPPRPSTRLSHTDGTSAALAAARRTDPKRLQSALTGELDWIVLKALEKDRTRRYETADAFRRDVERYLADEPVEARPHGVAYRWRKFVRRHRLTAAAAAFAAASLAAGFVGLGWGLLEANRAWRAESKRADGERQAKFEAMDARLVAEQVRDFLRYRILGQADVRQQADLLLRAGETTAEAKSNPTIREVLDRTARELTPEKAERYFPNQPRLQAELLKTVGDVYSALGEHKTAAEFLARAAGLWRATLGPEHPSTLAALHNLALARRGAGQVREAIALLTEVRDANLGLFGATHQETLITLNSLAVAHRDAGDDAAAIALLEEASAGMSATRGVDHPDTLTTLANLAQAYQAAGRFAEAVTLFERVAAARARALGADHPETLGVIANLATAYRAAGRLDDAVRLFEQARAGMETKRGPSHPDTLAVMNNLALAYQAAGRIEASLALFDEAATRAERAGLRRQRDEQLLAHAIDAFEGAKRFDRGEFWRRKRLAAVEQRDGIESCTYAGELAGLGWNLLKQENWVHAERVLRESLALRERLQPDFWGTYNTRSQLGGALLAQRRFAEAEPLLLDGYAGLAARESAIPPRAAVRLAEAVDRIVELYAATNRPDEANKWKAKRPKPVRTLVAPQRAALGTLATR